MYSSIHMKIPKKPKEVRLEVEPLGQAQWGLGEGRTHCWGNTLPEKGTALRGGPVPGGSCAWGDCGNRERQQVTLQAFPPRIRNFFFLRYSLLSTSSQSPGSRQKFDPATSPTSGDFLSCCRVELLATPDWE